MGLLDGLLGPKYEELSADSAAAKAIASHGVFEEFVKSANDRIEVVPDDGALYAFVGKPPKAFGLVWFDDSARYDVRSQMERGAMNREAAMRLVQSLEGVYVANSDAARYEFKVAGHKVVVTPSETMAAAIRDAIGEASS